MKSPGQIAYEAYGDFRSWLTVAGTAMPTWENQDKTLCSAWEAAATAVLGSVTEDKEG